MARLRYDNLSAELAGPLTDSATTATIGSGLEYGDGTAVPSISGDDYLVLAIVDVDGTIEVVYLTSYTSGSTTLTAITRGREGTDAVAHDSGTALRHVPTARDFDGNWLREIDGAYPTRADASTPAIFAGTVDPGPDGLDIMLDGDGWIDLSGTDAIASAIAFTPTGTIAATDVQAAIAEVAAEAGGLTLEQVYDALATALVAGTNMTITPNDGADTITFDASGGGGGGVTLEQVYDALATVLVAGTNMTITPNDGADTITFAASGGSVTLEDVRDMLATALVAAGGTTITPNDGSDTITIQSGILAVTAYDPVTIASVTIASSTVTDVDATNLAVTFTVPASGKVMVTLNAVVTLPGTNLTNVLNWALREASSTIGNVQDIGSATVQHNFRATAKFYVTGLTPGASKTYKWAQSRNTAGTGTTHMGGIAGAAVMTVEAVI